MLAAWRATTAVLLLGLSSAKVVEVEDTVDLADWTSNDGRALLQFAGPLVAPQLLTKLRSASPDPLEVGDLNDLAEKDFGIGNARVDAKNLQLSGLKSWQSLDPLEAVSSDEVSFGGELQGVTATLRAELQVDGASKEVCVFGSCTQVALPPLFGAQIKKFGIVSVELQQVKVKLTTLLQLDKNTLVLSQPETITESVQAISCQHAQLDFAELQVSVDWQSADWDLLKGVKASITDWLVEMLKPQLRPAIADGVNAQLCQQINTKVEDLLH